MAAQSFAALFLAHVIADYLLQTGWLVANKHRPVAIGLHIGAVFLAMLAVTLSFSWWFVALAVAHLAIDLLKTHVLPEGLRAYLADQILHITSIAAVAIAAPGLWAQSPLAGIDGLIAVYMATAGVIFAARGGQYAIVMPLTGLGAPGDIGVYLGWVERAALCAAVAIGVTMGGVPGALAGAGLVIALKLVHIALASRGRNPDGRARLRLGGALSLVWGLSVAVPLAILMPLMA